MFGPLDGALRPRIGLGRALGKGFARSNIAYMRSFYIAYRQRSAIVQTLSGQLQDPLNKHDVADFPITQTVSGQSETAKSNPRNFSLSWSHYVLLLSRSRSPEALAFYHAEALRGGWSVRQLERQLSSRFYERTALSKNKAAMLTRGAEPRAGDVVSADEQVRDPLVLEFLDLKDEYSESDLEDALVRHLELFLMELGGACGSATLGTGSISCSFIDGFDRLS